MVLCKHCCIAILYLSALYVRLPVSAGVSSCVCLDGSKLIFPPILVEVYYRVCAPHLNPSPHSVEPQAPDRLALALNLMESAVDAVEGRLKSPTKKQGVICRTLLKALLMECFAWLPPNTFPGSSARLFKVLRLMHVHVVRTCGA